MQGSSDKQVFGNCFPIKSLNKKAWLKPKLLCILSYYSRLCQVFPLWRQSSSGTSDSGWQAGWSKSILVNLVTCVIPGQGNSKILNLIKKVVLLIVLPFHMYIPNDKEKSTDHLIWPQPFIWQAFLEINDALNTKTIFSIRKCDSLLHFTRFGWKTSAGMTDWVQKSMFRLWKCDLLLSFCLFWLYDEYRNRVCLTCFLSSTVIRNWYQGELDPAGPLTSMM